MLINNQLHLVAITLAFAVAGCVPRTSIVEIRQTASEITVRVPPPDTENYSASEVVTYGFLKGFTPQGLIVGGPIAGALGGALYAYDEPCRLALHTVVEPEQKLESIVSAINVAEFSEQLRVAVPRYQEIQLSKKFRSLDAPYGNTWRHYILDIEKLTIGKRTRVGTDYSCNPGVDITAFYRLTILEDSSKSHKGLNSCSGEFSKQSL